ncbi:MAG: ABC transporter ATP-binding protein [Candidatus Kaiserbacteria bacterium]|nr:ABC transporter ATP-binding protein [Candidatus Kaiserbacteria bacterium]
MSTIKTENITKQFEGVHALDGVSLEIPRGRVTGIVGPNGSGKTTLVNVLSGIVRQDAGVLHIGGKEVSILKPQQVNAHGITRTFQEVRLFEQMTVLDNILVVVTERAVAASLFRRRQERCDREARQALETVGLWEKRSSPAAALSYGQRKLLEIARVLAMREAEVYLFDEPFAGLFPAMVDVVVKVMQGLKQEGKSVVLIEHSMDLIRQLCDTVIVMDEGKLLAQGTPETVFAKPEVIAIYVGK